MLDIIRDAPIGQIIRYVSGNRVLLYPEERPDFVCPKSYNSGSEGNDPADLPESGSSSPSDIENQTQQGLDDTTEKLEKALSKPIQPQKMRDGTILVTWYTDDDPANPQSWSSGKKAFVALQIW